MKNNTILTKERIFIIATGLLILLIGGVYRFSPEIQIFSAAKKAKMITKYQERTGKLPILEDQLVFLTAHTEKLSGYLIRAGSPELAGVAVQNMLRQMSSQEGISLKSIKALKADDKSYQYVSIVPVKLVLTAKIRQLKNLLYRIEASPKLLSVSQLRIIRPSADNSDDLNIIMTVQGFLDKKS